MDGDQYKDIIKLTTDIVFTDKEGKPIVITTPPPEIIKDPMW